MEDNVFPQPAVAGVLFRNYIEARLHTDAYDEDTQAVIMEQQLELQGGIGLPYYIALDPWQGKELASFENSGAAILDSTTFRDFLLEGVDRASPKVASESR